MPPADLRDGHPSLYFVFLPRIFAAAGIFMLGPCYRVASPMADLLVFLLRFKRLMNKGPITLSNVLFME